MGDVNLKLNEILETFEKKIEPIDEFEIEEVLKNLKGEVENKGSVIPYELHAEMMAFGFSENNQDREIGWGKYYGPTISGKYESGEMFEYPSIKNITEEVIKYWCERAVKAKHPVLKSRYADLIWDFSRTKTGKCSKPNIARIVIDATIDVVNKKLHKHETDVITKLKRVLSLVLNLNDKTRLEKIVDTTISYEDSIAQDDKLGLWGFSFDHLIGNRKISLSENQINKIISDLEKRLNRVTGDEHPDPFVAEAAAIRLAEYYKRQNQPEKLRDTLLKYGNSFLKVSKTSSALVGSAWLQKVYSTYLSFGLKSDADIVANELRRINKRSPEELKQISHKIEIPEDVVEKHINSMLEGDFSQVLSKIAKSYIPKRSEVEEQINVLYKKLSLQYLFNKDILDYQGTHVAKIGTIEDDLEGHIIRQISQNISILSSYLRIVIDRFKEKFSPSTEDLVKYLYESPVFTEEKKEIISKGLKAYLDGDYFVAVHLL